MEALQPFLLQLVQPGAQKDALKEKGGQEQAAGGEEEPERDGPALVLPFRRGDRDRNRRFHCEVQGLGEGSLVTGGVFIDHGQRALRRAKGRGGCGEGQLPGDALAAGRGGDRVHQQPLRRSAPDQ